MSALQNLQIEIFLASCLLETPRQKQFINFVMYQYRASSASEIHVASINVNELIFDGNTAIQKITFNVEST